MVDEFRSLRDNVFKILMGSNNKTAEEAAEEAAEVMEEEPAMDASTARALLAAIFARAGKSKDEIVQIIAREIGQAVAAMLREPLSQLAKHQKLQISFEFVPKDESDDEAGSGEEGSFSYGVSFSSDSRTPSRKKSSQKSTSSKKKKKSSSTTRKKKTKSSPDS